MNASLEALERFIAENDDLLALEQRLGRFNIFDALRVARVEVRHSNFLAWLLDPGESHGQGDLFLKALLMDLLRQAPAEARAVSPVELDGTDLHGVEVRREWKYIDLLLIVPEPRLVVAFENKMHGSERAEKLRKYQRALGDHFAGVPQLLVFLNPEGDEAPDERWLAYSYASVHRVLSRARATMSGTIGPDVGVVLDHYLRLLETRLMDDQKIAELCRRIYKNHRQAIELIVEHAGGDAQGLIGAMRERLEAMPGWSIVSAGRDHIRFMPEAWGAILPPLGEGGASAHEWLTFRATVKETQCTLVLSTRTVVDRDARNALLDRVFALGDREGLRPEFKTWRTRPRTKVLKDAVAFPGEGEEPEPEALATTVLDRAAAIAKRVEPILREACGRAG